MNIRDTDENVLAFVISIAAILAVTLVIVVSALALGGAELVFKRDFYFVCYTIRDNAVSADAISDTVSSYGGAGYVLEYEGNYYVTVACYYTENEAKTVKNSLLRRGLNCSVLNVSTEKYPIKPNDLKKYKKLYEGNLNTLSSLSELCYGCANKLDTGELNQSSAKDVKENVKSGLNALKKANPANCFTGELERLIAECDADGEGYILSKDMRKLQIAIADCIINIDLY